MRNSFALVISLFSLLPVVISVPVPAWNAVVVNAPAVNDVDSQTRVHDFDEANTRAGEMVNNMVKVVNSNDPKHKAIVEAAFGPNADHAKIKDTVEKLNSQQVKVGTTDIANAKDPRLVAVTPMPNRPNPPAGPIKLGPEFFTADASKDFRAGTLIHEATHQLAFTGDKVHTNDKMIGALEDQKVDVKMQPGTTKPSIGYQYQDPPNHKNPPKTAADLSQKYKDFVTTTQDTHNNADSYRVLAHLCSEPGVVRRDVLLFRRALMEADHEERHWLARRQSCQLPPDYFKKKAEAKAAAAKKAGSPTTASVGAKSKASPASPKSPSSKQALKASNRALKKSGSRVASLQHATRTGLKSKFASKGAVKSVKGVARPASKHAATKKIGHTSTPRTRKTAAKARPARQQSNPASRPASQKKSSPGSGYKSVTIGQPKKSGRK